MRTRETVISGLKVSSYLNDCMKPCSILDVIRKNWMNGTLPVSIFLTFQSPNLAQFATGPIIATQAN